MPGRCRQTQARSYWTGNAARCAGGQMASPARVRSPRQLSSRAPTEAARMLSRYGRVVAFLLHRQVSTRAGAMRFQSTGSSNLLPTRPCIVTRQYTAREQAMQSQRDLSDFAEDGYGEIGRA